MTTPSSGPSSFTACIIIIGNEILSGRTQDTNVAWLAKELNELGIRVEEVRVIPDVEQTIIDTVNTCRKQFTYIFTTGGIGPTHDDITSACIAKAFGAALKQHQEAAAILERHYGPTNLNSARMKMAEIPVGGTLIANPVSAAPGFQIENVYVMAGVPEIMRAMFDSCKHTLKGGDKTLSRTVSAFVTEGMFAQKLTAIAQRHPDVDIGSYPFQRSAGLGTSLVARATDEAALEAAYREVKAMLMAYTPEVIEDDLAA